MAMMVAARRRIRVLGLAGRREGILSAVDSLRYFAKIEVDPGGRAALLRAAEALESVHRK